MKHANTRQEHGRALKILDICERLNISRETASRLLDSGLLRGFKLDPTARRVEWRILPEDLDAYINEQAAASTSKQRQTRRRRPSVASYL